MHPNPLRRVFLRLELNMSAGTIALTNNSNIVAGTGTNFTSELKAGDFIGVMVGGAPYTLVVSEITSNTQLTISLLYSGPTSSALAWYAVPATLQVAITQKILNDMGMIARGMIQDKDNWQKIFSGDASVTVSRPDQSTFTGPSWGYMANQYANKAAKGANSDITSISGLTTALTVPQGGTGGNTPATARTGLGLGTASIQSIGTSGAAVPLLSTENTWSAGQVVNSTTFAITKPPAATEANGNQNMFYMVAASGAYSYCRQNIVGSYNTLYFGLGASQNEWGLYLRQNGDVVATSGQFLGQSDKRIKDKIEAITDPLTKMRNITGSKWLRLDTGRVGFGFIAQDVQQDFPEAVSIGGTTALKDGTEVEDTLVVDTNSVAAALHHQAILALMDKIEALELKLAAMQAS